MNKEKNIDTTNYLIWSLTFCHKSEIHILYYVIHFLLPLSISYKGLLPVKYFSKSQNIDLI